jgi:hypothetical protein
MADRFKFVDLSSPADARQKQSQRTEIRQHVMKSIGRQRRHCPRRKTKSGSSTEADVREVDEEQPYSSSHGNETCIKKTSPAPVLRRSLPSWGSFPVSGDAGVHELVRFGKSLSALSRQRHLDDLLLI